MGKDTTKGGGGVSGQGWGDYLDWPKERVKGAKNSGGDGGRFKGGGEAWT